MVGQSTTTLTLSRPCPPPTPWTPGHTNLFYDKPTAKYMMTTRSYVTPSGRDISIAVSTNGTAIHRNGTWSVNATGAYPPTVGVGKKNGCGKVDPANAAEACGLKCKGTAGCGFFWVYSSGKDAGSCCLKSTVLPGQSIAHYNSAPFFHGAKLVI